ncbi:MAG: AMP-binding protein, partial [Alphaproteobacteria bacterium]|nr:AMP-binding protein [Alphaproteobacteria bacterium]
MTPDPRLAIPEIERDDRPDGTVILRNRTALPDPLPDPLARWDHWLAQDGDAVFFSERNTDGIRTSSRVEMERLSNAYAAYLGAQGCGSSDRIAVIGGAGITHAALKIAALKTNLVHVPLSPALAASGFGRARLEYALSIVAPSLVVDLTGRMNDAVTEADLPEPTDANFDAPGTTLDSLAAIYFTSGSTGEPKGVVVTRQMIASCQAAYAAHWPFLADHRPVLIDWLPWHHVFGGLDNFYKTIWNGGEYHAENPPGAENMDTMAKRIRSVRPTLHINVPYGIDLLLDRLDDDPDTRAALFHRLDAIFFAGAGMGDGTWHRLRDTVAHAGENPPLLLTGYGATEAGSTMCLSHRPAGSTAE